MYRGGGKAGSFSVLVRFLSLSCFSPRRGRLVKRGEAVTGTKQRVWAEQISVNIRSKGSTFISATVPPASCNRLAYCGKSGTLAEYRICVYGCAPAFSILLCLDRLFGDVLERVRTIPFIRIRTPAELVMHLYRYIYFRASSLRRGQISKEFHPS